MEKYEFTVIIYYGPGDYDVRKLDFDVAPLDLELIEEAFNENNYELSKIEGLEDLSKEVYAAAVEQEKELLRKQYTDFDEKRYVGLPMKIRI